MITWLEDLVVSGGGDCAEYALSGMLKGTVHKRIHNYTGARVGGFFKKYSSDDIVLLKCVTDNHLKNSFWYFLKFNLKEGAKEYLPCNLDMLYIIFMPINSKTRQMIVVHIRYLGIEMSNVKSKIYLCTDADAKDEDKQGEVMAGLMAKQLTPVFLLTGQCSRRRRKRNSDGGSYMYLLRLFLEK